MGRDVALESLTEAITSGRLRSCVVLHAGALGDFALTHHVLARLRRGGPGLRLDTVARSPLARWVAGRGVVDTAHDYESFGVQELYAEHQESAAVRRLRAYDLVLNFLGGDDTAPANRLRRGGVRAVCIDPAASARSRHITEQWCDTLSGHGLVLGNTTPVELRISEEERAAARARLVAAAGGDGRPLVIIHPGSGGRAKCCPVAKLACIARGLAENGARVVWMVGPTELEWNGADWMNRIRAAAPVVLEEDVGAAAALVAGADAFVGNDAGMTHVAALTGVATVALFGPTDADVWRPLGPRVRVVRGGPTFEQTEAGDVVRRICSGGSGSFDDCR